MVPGTGNAGSGSASLDAPAVMERTVYERDGPFVTERTERVGALINVSSEVAPGRGRVLVNTTPLMGEVFQDAAITAAYVAQERTGRNLSRSDVIVSIVADDQVPAVDGGSAGALMTLLTIAALQGWQPRSDMTLTGTIDQDGNVGAIGGVVEKATAAKEEGKTLFLLPRENSQSRPVHGADHRLLRVSRGAAGARAGRCQTVPRVRARDPGRVRRHDRRRAQAGPVTPVVFIPSWPVTSTTPGQRSFHLGGPGPGISFSYHFLFRTTPNCGSNSEVDEPDESKVYCTVLVGALLSSALPARSTREGAGREDRLRPLQGRRSQALFGNRPGATFKLMGVRWATFPVAYSLNHDNSGFSSPPSMRSSGRRSTPGTGLRRRSPSIIKDRSRRSPETVGTMSISRRSVTGTLSPSRPSGITGRRS